MRALVIASALLALTAAPAAASQPSSPEESAAAVARPGIVFVTVEWHGWVRDKRTGEVFGGADGYVVKATCSGAVIRPDGHVATASHCVHTGPQGGAGALFDAAIEQLAAAGRVGDRAAAKAQLVEHAVAEGASPDRPIDRAIQVERVEATGDGPIRDVAPATVVDLVAPTDGDVAVLKVPRDNLPSLEIRTDQTPVGTPILAIGYPGSAGATVDPSLEPSNKNGQISARRTQNDRPFYEFSAAATHGMSGGPVVDMEGRVVGLISQGAPGETQSFNFAAASSTLLDLLAGKDVKAELGAHDRDYRAGLDRYFAGDFDGAVEGFDDVLAASPGHLQATEYRRLAVERGGTAGGDSVLLVVFAVLCAGVAVGTATAGTAIALTRRRRLRPVGPAAPVDSVPVGSVPGGHSPMPVPVPDEGFAGVPAKGTPAFILPQGSDNFGSDNFGRAPADAPVVSDVDTPPFGIPLPPAALGLQPQPDREAETDKVQREEPLTLRDDRTEQQTEPRRQHVDQAHQGHEDEKP
ncbi:trypsin-like peptidase domain-containing protein [Saccharothrix deserti]|uniref:trypsin-like peptidase domain-containing protein n=1 Tax=Saccharothrix deserti TaxID=2593674 RepID=UPI00131A97C5|nr:trypsin-like peptidase domain-containing protein [Saccharothrix deserti]